MAASPKYKIYSPSRKYIGCCKHAEDAAALAALYGDGATVKLYHKRVLWTEGKETFSAAESYDSAAEMMHRREALASVGFIKQPIGKTSPA